MAWSRPVGGSTLTLGLSGHYGRGPNESDNFLYSVPVGSWGVALDYTVPFSKFFNLTGETFVGRALGIFSVTAGESVVLFGSPGQHGAECRGGWIQAKFNFTRRWQMNLGYGTEIPKASRLPIGARWRNQSYMAYLF